MPIIPVPSNTKRDSEGYELDDQGNRIYPQWAAYIPPGAKTHGNARPPWVPSIANYWDEAKPPYGWYKLADGTWGNALDEDHVKEHPELNEMLEATIEKDKTNAAAAREGQPEGEPVPPASAAPTPEPEGGIRCKVCDKACASPAGLKVHMAHHRRSDQHHAEASAQAEAPEGAKAD